MAKKNCITCGHHKLDEVFGEHKCLKYQHKIYHPMATFECEGHEKKQEEKNGKKHARTNG